ncbi:MAG: type III pantothenate kinase [Rhodospirillales bacterium]|jgi:type III pantothenate kinase|nr:type III pantothenate kinase [Rhodospirillales bacterium]MBT4040814.1 type III pantothenate kinase [Rhodospirillales bacterium]MBT5352982.1 type III pantothenate kinase [Rhodospirillales bacterium]MBT5520343.1 type III pantothenate kinase [Rhodospirillales bacterium]MBT7146875.1 type III pantothenate kinase [Rhodospirillales bacterium]
MLLAINVNNTNVKFAIADGESVVAQWRIATDPARTADEYAVWLTHLMALKNLAPDDVTDSIVSIVVPQALFEIKVLCRNYFGCDPWVIGEGQVDLGIEVLINTPEEAGADRLVNAVAGHTHYGGPLIIVDFGTATTFDIVDEAGSYVGGIIAPGINLSVEALHLAAAKLPRITVERPTNVVGKSTVEAMKSGVYWGYTGLIEGLVRRIREEHHCPDMKVIVTGGLAPLFADASEIFDTIDSDLTMKGLLAIHRRNVRLSKPDGENN